MAKLLFANKAKSVLAAPLTSSATSLTVTSGTEDLFPTPTGGDWFPLHLIDAHNNTEILRCIGRAGTVLTISRAQEGTAAMAFPAGSKLENRMTAGAFTELQNTLLEAFGSDNAAQHAVFAAGIAALELSKATAAQGTKADTALQPDDIGDSVQAHDVDLDALAALTYAPDTIPYATGAGAFSLTSLTAAARGFLATASALAMRAYLGLAIGTDVQAHSDNLDEIDGTNPGAAGLTLLAAATAADQLTALGGTVAGIEAFTKSFRRVADVQADATMTYGNTPAGTLVHARADFFSYEVAASGASDHHITTVGGVKLYVLPCPDGYYANAFGAIGDDATVNTTAIQTALNAAAGNELKFRPGIYRTLSLAPPSYTTMIGKKGRVTLKMDGVGAGNLINHNDKTNLVIRGITFYGNNSGTAAGNGAAIRCYMQAAAPGHGENYEITDCHFENFRADVWVQFVNYSTSYAFKNIRINGNTWKSLSGNCRDGATLGVQSTCVAFSGELNNPCYLEDIECNNNVADGTFIKRFAEFWNGCRRFSCCLNKLRNFGTDAVIANDGGNYVIMLYDSSIQIGMRQGLIAENTIDTFKAVGIYCAGASDTVISANNITHGSATADGNMPKGAIVLGAGWDILCTGNYVEDMGRVGIRWTGVPAFSGAGAGHTDIFQNITISSNTVKDTDYAIRLDGSALAIGLTIGGITVSDNRTSSVVVKGNTLSENIYGVTVQCYGPALEDITVADNDITSVVASAIGIQTIAYGGGALGPAGFSCKDVLFKGNKINVTTYGIRAPSVLGSLVIRENTISGDVGGRGIEATSCESLALISNTFQNFTAASAACYYTLGSKGVMDGTAFLNVDTSRISVGVTDMGRAAPTWTPVGRGAYVQSLLAVEAGTTPKYINEGWYWDSASWKEQRRPTGN